MIDPQVSQDNCKVVVEYLASGRQEANRYFLILFNRDLNLKLPSKHPFSTASRTQLVREVCFHQDENFRSKCPLSKGPWKLVSKSFSNQKLCFLRWQKHNKTLIKISVLLFTLFSPSYISPPEVGTHCVCEITARHRRRARALFYFTSSTFFQVCKCL